MTSHEEDGERKVGVVGFGDDDASIRPNDSQSLQDIHGHVGVMLGKQDEKEQELLLKHHQSWQLTLRQSLDHSS